MNEEASVASSYAQKVGEQLRAVRKRKRLSLQAVEAASSQEFKASVLGAYERGERAISVPRLQRLAKFYEVAVDSLLPRDVAPDEGGEGRPAIDLRSPIGAQPQASEVIAGLVGSGERERITVDLTRLDSLTGRERDLLTRYLGMIQMQRQDFNGRMLTVRQEDIRALALLFETSAENMRRMLSDFGVLLKA